MKNKKKKKKDSLIKYKEKKEKKLKRKEEQRKKSEQLLFELQDLVKKYGSKIPFSEKFISRNKDTNSWFDIKVQNKKMDTFNVKFNLEESKSNKIIKCNKIILLPTLEQKVKLLKWMDAYRIMYNKTLHLIKKNK